MPKAARRLRSKGHQANERFRGNAYQRGYTRQWRLASKRFLKCNPLCRQCTLEGRTKLAECVDHIKPHRGNQDLFWRTTNWQPLCKRCHDAKTQRGE